MLWDTSRQKQRGEKAQREEISVSISFEQSHVKLCLTLSLLSALAACLHNGCHTSHPEEEKDRSVLGVSLHTVKCTPQCLCVSECVDVLASSFTCQIHFLSLFEHHVTAGTAGAGRMVLFPSRLRKEEGVTEHALPL